MHKLTLKGRTKNGDSPLFVTLMFGSTTYNSPGDHKRVVVEKRELTAEKVTEVRDCVFIIRKLFGLGPSVGKMCV